MWNRVLFSVTETEYGQIFVYATMMIIGLPGKFEKLKVGVTGKLTLNHSANLVVIVVGHLCRKQLPPSVLLISNLAIADFIFLCHLLGWFLRILTQNDPKEPIWRSTNSIIKMEIKPILKILNIDSQFSTSNCLSNYQVEGFQIELDYFREALLILTVSLRAGTPVPKAS